MSSVDKILSGYDGLQAGQEAFYQDLHRHPELSHQEHRTARRSRRPCHRPPDSTDVVQPVPDGQASRKILVSKHHGMTAVAGGHVEFPGD